LQSDACGSPVENTHEKEHTGRAHVGEGGGKREIERTGGGGVSESGLRSVNNNVENVKDGDCEVR
jgi:hypothetical protein